MCIRDRGEGGGGGGQPRRKQRWDHRAAEHQHAGPAPWEGRPGRRHQRRRRRRRSLDPGYPNAVIC
eukprot:3419277-Pyramimonas_sp.AAC.1